MNNAAAIGYAILAAKEMRLYALYIAQLESSMRRMMEEKTEAEAEEAYRNN